MWFKNIIPNSVDVNWRESALEGTNLLKRFFFNIKKENKAWRAGDRKYNKKT